MPDTRGQGGSHERNRRKSGIQQRSVPGIETGKPLIQQIGKKHLDILDGLPVQTEPGGYGIIHYEVDGEGYELYPIMPEWCEERGQTSLFTQDGGTEE